MTSSSSAEEIEIRSVSDLLTTLSKYHEPSELLWYRGHARASWTLQPSLVRRDGLSMERALLEEFKRDAIPLLSRAELSGGPMSEWDWVFVMQHYQVPTRLMDWSESPLAGLFFALDDAFVDDDSEAACLWVLRPVKMNAAARVFPKHPWQVPVCGETHQDLDKYLPTEVDNGFAELAPLAVAAIRRFDRIRAQRGVFTIVHKNPQPLEEIVGEALTKYVIPEDSKDTVRQELDRLGYHAASMYPDLEHLGRRIARRLK